MLLSHSLKYIILFNKRKKLIKVWNNLRASKWQKFHFWEKYPFNKRTGGAWRLRWHFSQWEPFTSQDVFCLICTYKKIHLLKHCECKGLLSDINKIPPSNLYKMVKQKSLFDNHNECDWFNLTCEEKSNRYHGITLSIATSEIWTRSYTWTITLAQKCN